jgi:hypothetical protein
VGNVDGIGGVGVQFGNQHQVGERERLRPDADVLWAQPRDGVGRESKQKSGVKSGQASGSKNTNKNNEVPTCTLLDGSPVVARSFVVPSGFLAVTQSGYGY